ncbi:protein-tyrosine phosphatase family protein [Micromonospora haikouensis]|uniref:protein-tyrosine phosphatase family protein n=1 Tax=Micromonospora haikouensis TaxID=686309 RepID=UPI003D728733
MDEITLPAAPWHEIIPGLWMGGHDFGDFYDPIPAIVDDEFDRVVSLFHRPGHGPHPAVAHTIARIRDGKLHDYDLDMIRDLAGSLAADVRDGRKVLIRCQAGLNRSGLLTAFVLIRLGHSPTDAIRLIRARRSPHALFNEHFVLYIAEEEFHG